MRRVPLLLSLALFAAACGGTDLGATDDGGGPPQNGVDGASRAPSHEGGAGNTPDAHREGPDAASGGDDAAEPALDGSSAADAEPVTDAAPSADGGANADGGADAHPDAQAWHDASSPPPPADAGHEDATAPAIDAGTPGDAGAHDATLPDAAVPDAAVPDAAPPPPPPPPPDASVPDSSTSACMIPPSAFVVPDPAPIALPPETAPFGNEVRQLSLAANGLAYDPRTRLLFASTPSAAGAQGNSIVTIDPVSATIKNVTYVGSEPTRLALSRDGQFLYTNLRGADAIRRFDVATETAGPQFTLGHDANNTPYDAIDLQVLPRSPHSVVVALSSSSYYASAVAVFDDGVPRPVVASAYAYNNGTPTLLASNSDALVFGIDSSSQTSLQTLCVDARGITFVSANAVFAGAVAQLAYASPNVYASSGGVFNAATGALVGTYGGASGSYYGSSVIALDIPANRTYLFAQYGAPAGLLAYEADHFTPVGSIPMPPLPSTNGTQLVRWGRYGLAYLDSNGEIVIVRSPLVAQP